MPSQNTMWDSHTNLSLFKSNLTEPMGSDQFSVWMCVFSIFDWSQGLFPMNNAFSDIQLHILISKFCFLGFFDQRRFNFSGRCLPPDAGSKVAGTRSWTFRSRPVWWRHCSTFSTQTSSRSASATTPSSSATCSSRPTSSWSRDSSRWTSLCCQLDIFSLLPASLLPYIFLPLISAPTDLDDWGLVTRGAQLLMT